MLKGKDIVLRPIKLSDAQSICDNISKDVVRYMMNVPYPYSIKDARDFIKKSQKAWNDKTSCRFGVVFKDTNKVIGMMGLEGISQINKNAELGYWIGKKYWRMGIGADALKLVVDYGFKTLKLHKIYARVYHPNIKSAKLLEKGGFQLEGCLKEQTYKHKQWYDELRYGIIKKNNNN